MEKNSFESWKSYLDDVGHLDKFFGKYSKLYLMTTENIAGILNNVTTSGKKVLTVAGSGDHVLESVLHGAEDITCFDINPFSFNQVDLKLAAIKSLSYEEFLKFFNIRKLNDENRFFDHTLFEKLSSNLNDQSCNFYSYLYDYYNNDVKKIKKNIYYNFLYNLNHMKTMCNYLKKENYYEVKDRIDDTTINYLESDFRKLRNNLNNKYDLILLSNINDYIDELYGNFYISEFYNNVMELTNNLNSFGTIQIAYFYTHLDYPMRANDLYIKEIRDKYFSICDTVEVDAYDDIATDTIYKDKVLLYKKKR